MNTPTTTLEIRADIKTRLIRIKEGMTYNQLLEKMIDIYEMVRK